MTVTLLQGIRERRARRIIRKARKGEGAAEVLVVIKTASRPIRNLKTPLKLMPAVRPSCNIGQGKMVFRQQLVHVRTAADESSKHVDLRRITQADRGAVVLCQHQMKFIQQVGRENRRLIEAHFFAAE